MLMAGVDELLARGLDRRTKRLAITGGSYGGFMTSWIIGHTSGYATALRRRL